ncbi:MAG: alpha/beta hydrolase [Alphaproteobacteria bacterium]|nr:alpha/beta hydrolase [Alphaproteobacteria bacterium]
MALGKSRYLFACALALAAALGAGLAPAPASAANPYEGTVPAITSGYGAYGPYSVSKQQITNPAYVLKKVVVFYPNGISGVRPTIFFSHAYGANDVDTYLELMNNLASNGYVVVFTPYATLASNDQRYTQLWSGFQAAVSALPTRIDTTRVGFVGHSFGGGATPEMARRGFAAGWGANGRFMFMLAPWYSLQISQTQLQSFPSNTKLVVQVYEDDDKNDHRMGIDIFNTVNIAAAEKDYVRIGTDTADGYTFESHHVVPSQGGLGGVYNGYDYWGVFRHIQALATYAFTGNATAKSIALGNGGATQIDMGTSTGGHVMKKLSVTDSPAPFHAQSFYLYPCNSTDNPRASYCAP